MPPPTYPHRHLLLTGLLDSVSAQPPPDAFVVRGVNNDRGCKLDAILLEGWSATGSRANKVDKDELQHAENLRLKKTDFEVLGRVGEGQFGVVDAVRCRLDGKVYAMKTIERNMVIRAGSQLTLSVERHIHTLASSSSPAPAFAASFQSPTSLHLLTSFAPCGSLWDRLCEMLPVPGLDTGRMEEEEVAWWAKQMVSAITWLHGAGYCHRDIKPHNFLLLPDCRLQLTDFGSAAPITKGTVSHRLCMLPIGTPDYVAPEVLSFAEEAVIEAALSDANETDADRTVRLSDTTPGYGCEVDWWSLGATLYEMSVGRAPFFSQSIGSTYERIMRCDVRMPSELSPPLKSLLSGLLSSRDVRLGKGDVSAIRRHSFFRDIDWSQLGTPPPGVVCQPIDLATLADEFDHSTGLGEDITFDHFFNTTVAGFSTMTSSPSIAMGAPPTWGRWVGWSMDPPADFFGSEAPPAILVSPPTLRAMGIVPRQHSAPPATNMFTPMRQGMSNGLTPPTVPRSAPRSVPRTRPVSERQAFAELIQCVQASARKKIASEIKVIPGSASTVSSAASHDWRKDHPPTPTPMSRDMTALASTIITGSRTNSDESRPTSRASSRSGERPLSRNSMRQDGPLPARTMARTSSLPIRDQLPPRPVMARTSSLFSHVSSNSNSTARHLSSRGSIDLTTRQRSSALLGSKDDTFLSKLVAAENDENRPPRPLSRQSTSSGEYIPSTSREDRVPIKQGGKRGSTIAEDSRSDPRSHRSIREEPKGRAGPLQITRSLPNGGYVPPLDPDPSKSGDRIASMQVWHRSLESDLSNLERRLADLTAQFNGAD